MKNKNKGYEEVVKNKRYRGMFTSEKEAMTTMTLRLPSYIVSWIEREAEKNNLTKTALARDILVGCFKDASK